jgi:hypothetical protein
MSKPAGDNESSDFRKALEERLAKLSPEEQRAWFLRLADRLGIEVELVDPAKPPEDGEPK